MTKPLDGQALDQLFRTARTRNGWTDRPVTEKQLRELYDLVKFGPTSANCCPARFVWVRSGEGKARLAAHAMDVNKAKILAARRETSISGLLAKEIEFLVGEEEAYERAERQAMALLDKGFRMGGMIRAGRDELHER